MPEGFKVNLSLNKRLVALGLFLLCAATSCAVRDGPYVDVEGKPLDQGLVRQLESRKATIEEVVSALGRPTKRVDDGGKAVLTYINVRERKSSESLVGIPMAASTQRVIATWTLEFVEGKLANVRVTQDEVAPR